MKPDEIVDNLSVVIDAINTHIKQVMKSKNLDLNASQICILRLISDNGGIMKVGDIISYIKKRKTTVAEILKVLEEKGYITKQQCSIDRRELYVSGTKKLSEEISEITKAAVNIIENIYKDFTNGEKILFTEMLERIEKNLK